jgi:hypothetical protein
MAISGIVSSSSREVPYAPASVSGSDVGTARAYNNASAIVSFTAPVYDGGLPVTGYAVTSSPGGLTASGASSPLTITGLSSSTSYTYNVTATNSIGTGPAITSGSVFATTIPQSVTIGTATATGVAGTATVAYTPNATGGKTVTYTATSNPGGFTATGTSPITFTGLTNGTSYTFTVVAANANGAAAASAASNAITPYTYVPPPGPVGNTAPTISASSNSVTITTGTWINSPTQYQYRIYRSSDNALVGDSGLAPTSSTSFTQSGLAYSTNYYGTQTASSSNPPAATMTATPNPVTTGPAPVGPSVPRNLFILANTTAVGGTYGFTCPDTGALPITVHWGLSAPYAATLVTSGTFTCNNYSDSTSFSQGSNGYYSHFAYATNAGGTSATVSANATFDYAPCVAATSMAGKVSGQAFTINGYQGEFTWTAPPEAGTYRYSYSVNGQGGAITSNTSVYLTSLTAGTTYTIVIYAQKLCPATGLYLEGTGAGTASFTTASPPAYPGTPSVSAVPNGSSSGGSLYFTPSSTNLPYVVYYRVLVQNVGVIQDWQSVSVSNTNQVLAYTTSNNGGFKLQAYAEKSGLYVSSLAETDYVSFTYTPTNYYWCTTSANCAGVGNCTYSQHTTQQTNYSTIDCNYSATQNYPACYSTADATCTGNLSCCSVPTKYQCNSYDVSYLPGACYTLGACDSTGNTFGGFTNRTPCCPPKC